VDTEIWLYEPGNEEETVCFDFNVVDDYTTILPTEPGDYHIRLTRLDEDFQVQAGEYCLYVTTGRVLAGQPVSIITSTGRVYPTLFWPGGSYDNPADGVQSILAPSREEAQPLDFDTPYYARFFNGKVDGDVGHWYVFTVTEEEDD
jgi:hypothetical protein